MVNFDKSHIIFSLNTSSTFVRIMRKPLGVSNKIKVGTYLGFPEEVNGRNTASFNDILHKTINIISSWKFINLSQTRKLILINIMLSSLVSHIIYIYLLSKRTQKKNSLIFLKFWWSWTMDKTPIYWRKKKEVLESHKDMRGLGMRNISCVKKSLLFNKAWRIHRNQSLLIHIIYKVRHKDDPLSLALANKKLVNSTFALEAFSL